MSNYKIGEKYYLEVKVVDINEDKDYAIGVKLFDGYDECDEYLKDSHGLLHTFDEICAELILTNKSQAERIQSLQIGLQKAEDNYDAVYNELSECRKKLKEAGEKIRTLSRKNKCLRKEADRGDVIAKALADTILDICDDGDLILVEE